MIWSNWSAPLRVKGRSLLQRLRALHERFFADAFWLWLVYSRKFEPEVWKALRNLRGELAVDVGAQVGFYTIMFSRNFKRVIAIEPNPVNVQNLILLVSYNGIPNVEVISAAAGIQEGRTKLNIPSSNRYGGGSIIREGAQSIEVQQIRLDNLLATEKSVDLVKIDVEGAEFLVLEGARETLKRTRHLMIELHDTNRKAEVEKLERLLSEYSFRLAWLSEKGEQFQHLLANKSH